MKAASLTSALLAAKGAATPAGLAAPMDPLMDPLAPRPRGTRRPALVLTGGEPVGAAPRPSGRAQGGARAGTTSAPTEGERPVRVSFRLDQARHLRLRLVAAHGRRSVSACLIEAVDRYLDHMAPRVGDGHCYCVAGGDDHDD